VAENNGIVRFSPLDTVSRKSIKAKLEQDIPVLFGLYVDDAFVDPQIPLPPVVRAPDSANAAINRHCLLVVGYDYSSDSSDNDSFTVVDSLAPLRGNPARPTTIDIAADYLLDPRFAGDFWVVDEVAIGVSPNLLAARDAYVADARQFRGRVTRALDAVRSRLEQRRKPLETDPRKMPSILGRISQPEETTK
jgi:hypothetical protein